ncbi:hypothetical protein BDV33DRAFT_170562 [Aspergillus novoparasiticus]|uniref:Uncharacterized protein n=1 Tax=Aspergillus novoparasiticus TaxID=986946 RepID=A0A5N6EVT6_9EURO|nr:hypothetical protein BDV33DRAFT_170562 [Aspergillus novoparasiticus]
MFRCLFNDSSVSGCCRLCYWPYHVLLESKWETCAECPATRFVEILFTRIGPATLYFFGTFFAFLAKSFLGVSVSTTFDHLLGSPFKAKGLESISSIIYSQFSRMAS